MTSEEDYKFMETWIRAQAHALAPEVDATWTIAQCVRVIAARIAVPAPDRVFDADNAGAYQALHFIESMFKQEMPDSFTESYNKAFNEVRSHLRMQEPDPRIGTTVEYSGEDSYYRGRVAGIVRKYNRVTGEHDGPERFVVQDDRGLLLIKGAK